MSDFGELCPLFNTGVFNEITFPSVRLSVCTLCENALYASVAAAASSEANFNFGRTVIVTGAWVKKREVNESAVVAQLMHHTSKNAVGTAFGSLVISATVTGYNVGYGYYSMTVVDTTFISSDILGFSGKSVVTSGGSYDLIVRYKEK